MKKDFYILTLVQEPLLGQLQLGLFFHHLFETNSKPSASWPVQLRAILSIPPMPQRSQQKAFQWSVVALGRACLRQIRDHQLPPHLWKVMYESDAYTQTLNLQLSEALFEAPSTMVFLSAFGPLYRDWLVAVWGATLEKAEIMAQQLPRVFAEELNAEWFDWEDHYLEIKTQLFKAPLEADWQRAYYRYLYRQKLRNQCNKPLPLKLVEGTLKDLYIPCDFFIYKTHQHVPKQVKEYNLHESIKTELLNPTPKAPRLLVVLGQPGQGKTSFCQMLLHDLVGHVHFERPLVFVPLRRIVHTGQLIRRPFEVFDQYMKATHQIRLLEDQQLTKPYQGACIVLDGLDELYMKGGLTNKDIHAFLSRLLELLKQHDSMTVLITSRHHYINIEPLDTQTTRIFKLAPLSFEQQKEWLQRYHQLPKTSPNAQQDTLTLEHLKHIHDRTHLSHIRELIEQPLLLLLIVSSGMKMHMRLDRHQISRSKIYDQLFTAFINRQWQEKQVEKYSKLQNDSDIFRSWLREIAFEIYQSPNEYITEQQFKNLPTTQKLQEQLPETADFNDTHKDLLVLFYFKANPMVVQDASNAAPQPLRVIEFLHKSLREYLTAEYILTELEARLVPTLKTAATIKPLAVLRLFFQWFAQKTLHLNLRRLLAEQMRERRLKDRAIHLESDATTDAPHPLYTVLRDHFAFCLQHQFLDSYQASANPLIAPNLQMAATFDAYWWILVHLSPRHNGKLIQAQYRDAFCNWLQLPNQRECDYLKLYYINLDGADLSYATLNRTYLRGADLKEAQLRHVQLNGADLTGTYLEAAMLEAVELEKAILIRADFRKANLRKANLNAANLKEACLKGSLVNRATLKQANLQRAILKGMTAEDADFTGANLSNANLLQVKLTDAILTRASFNGANLEQANLSKVKANKAEFKNAVLRSARLPHAQLSGANFTDADLRGAELRAAHLEEATLLNANLAKTTLVNANLRNADLTNANISQADLTGVNLSGAILTGVYYNQPPTISLHTPRKDVQIEGARVIEQQLPPFIELLFNKNSPPEDHYYVDPTPEQDPKTNQRYYIIRKKRIPPLE